MAKRRKLKDVIQVEKLEEDKSMKPPKCFGNYAAFCLKELCGEWFEKCKEISGD